MSESVSVAADYSQVSGEGAYELGVTAGVIPMAGGDVSYVSY